MLRNFYDRYLPSLFWPVLLVLITWGTYHYVIMPESLVPGANGNGQVDSEAGKRVIAKNPRLAEMSPDGTIRWEIWSESLEGTLGKGGELTVLSVIFTLPDGSRLTVDADRGSYDETEKHLEVSGNVAGNYPDASMNFTCNTVNYFQADEKLAMSGDVRLSSEREGVNIACPEVVANLTENLSVVEFTGGVDIDLYKLK